MVKSINHIGICVKSIDKTMEFLKAAMGAEEISRKAYPNRGQVSSLVSVGGGIIVYELMEPTGEIGIVADFIAKRGEGIHHISLNTDDLDEECRKFEKTGAKILGRVPGIAFVHPKTTGGVLYEITDGTFSE